VILFLSKFVNFLVKSTDVVLTKRVATL